MLLSARKERKKKRSDNIFGIIKLKLYRKCDAREGNNDQHKEPNLTARRKSSRN